MLDVYFGEDSIISAVIKMIEITMVKGSKYEDGAQVIADREAVTLSLSKAQPHGQCIK